mmetsp:Transcript_62521/g.111396  ORF Transcript_62521/g.111396 Transcript_62521/m.111396 type:complete len:230 (+) Transcript_62521:1196-1885(+)
MGSGSGCFFARSSLNLLGRISTSDSSLWRTTATRKTSHSPSSAQQVSLFTADSRRLDTPTSDTQSMKAIWGDSPGTSTFEGDGTVASDGTAGSDKDVGTGASPSNSAMGSTGLSRGDSGAGDAPGCIVTSDLGMMTCWRYAGSRAAVRGGIDSYRYDTCATSPDTGRRCFSGLNNFRALRTKGSPSEVLGTKCASMVNRRFILLSSYAYLGTRRTLVVGKTGVLYLLDI